MPSLGKIEEFDPDLTNIDRYLEHLEQYFVANGAPADSTDRHKRRATLISYDVLSDLCSPLTPSQKTYTQLATILKDHFAPKKLVIAERYRFHNCTQCEGESVSSFAANLKHLAATCQLSAHLSEALRDRLVCGLQSKEMQKKLLTEEHNFDEALKNALSLEAAEKDVAAFSHEGLTPVNKLGKGNHQNFARHAQYPMPFKKQWKQTTAAWNPKTLSKCRVQRLGHAYGSRSKG